MLRTGIFTGVRSEISSMYLEFCELSEPGRGKDTAQFFRIKGFQQIVGCLDIVAFHSIGITACNEDQSGSVFCIAQFSGCIHTGHGVHVNVHNDQVIKAWRIFCEKGLCTGIQTDVCGCVPGFIVRRDNRFYLPADLLLNHQGLQYSKRVPPDKLRSSYLV